MTLTVFVLRFAIGFVLVIALLSLLHVHVAVTWDRTGNWSPITVNGLRLW